MSLTSFYQITDAVRCSAVRTPSGSDEFYLVVLPQAGRSFLDTITEIEKEYRAALLELNLSELGQVFSRLCISDISSQHKTLVESELYGLCRTGAWSVVEQRPVNGAPAVLFAYHVSNKQGPPTKKCFSLDESGWQNAALVYGQHYNSLWTAGLWAEAHGDSFEQARQIFAHYNNLLHQHDMTLLDHALRTWVYVRDIDHYYAGMVEARAAFFDLHGLTASTRFVASTGVGARMRENQCLVSMDAVALQGLKQGQMSNMHALENLNRPSEYGVTFERGTRVDFGDRTHLYLSGTASIDEQGEVVHAGNVAAQTERTLENMEALLHSEGAGLKDMLYFVVYLRDAEDHREVSQVLDAKLHPEVPVIIVEGAVCRPAWLVEIEGVAVLQNSDPRFPAFF